MAGWEPIQRGASGACVCVCVMALCVAVLFLLAPAAAVPRGVPPTLADQYPVHDLGLPGPATRSFQCLSAPHLTLSAHRVNDEYCDCVDGSDEPGTSACSHVSPSPQFFCVANPSHTFFIPTSRVHDGVCDCCDGGDEDAAVVSCPNSCKQLAVDLLREDKETAQRYQRGLRQKMALLATADAVAVERERKWAALLALEGRLTASLEPLRALSVEKNMVERRRQTQFDHGVDQMFVEDLRLLHLETEFLVQIALPNVCINAGRRGVEALTKLFPSRRGTSRVERENIQNLTRVFLNGIEQSDTDWPADEVGFELVQRVVDAARVGGAASPWPEDPAKGRRWWAHCLFVLANATDTLPYMAEVVLEEWERRQTVPAVGGRGPVEDRARRLVDARGARGSYTDRVAEMTRLQLAHAERAVSDVAGDMQTMRAQSKILNVPEHRALVALLDECFEFSMGKYKYTVCLFDHATQDSTSLGKFEALEQNVMLFGNGQVCPGGQRRELAVRFRCGDENALHTVIEPSPCSYEATFDTPALCGETEENFVQEVQEKERSFEGIDGSE